MPGPVKQLYEEARQIAEASPRGAGALLRLAIDKLTEELGAEGSSLNDRIGDLVKKGLNPQIQKMLDTIRVVGNNAVHPGEIQVHEDRAIVDAMFPLLNRIVESMITEPAQLDALYNGLPEGARKAVSRRDNNS